MLIVGEGSKTKAFYRSTGKLRRFPYSFSLASLFSVIVSLLSIFVLVPHSLNYNILKITVIFSWTATSTFLLC